MIHHFRIEIFIYNILLPILMAEKIRELSDLEIRIYNASLKFAGELNKISDKKDKEYREKLSNSNVDWHGRGGAGVSNLPIYFVLMSTSPKGNSEIKVQQYYGPGNPRWEISYDKGVLTPCYGIKESKVYINFLAKHIPEVKALIK